MDELLWPQPQEWEATGETLGWSRQPVIRAGSGAERVAVRLREILQGLGFQPGLDHGLRTVTSAWRVDLRLDSVAAPRAQGYRLQVHPRGADVTGTDEAGLFYGVQTLAQWLRLHAGRADRPPLVPCLSVRDWPDFPQRGVLLDISRDKVPTLSSLFKLVELLAGWKINQLQLYTEHTFAYPGHEVVWHKASPMTPEDVQALDAFCQERFVELVPNQNSLGHMHRWLSHDDYRHLAECPDGVKHAFSDRVEPFSLCPVDPGSLDLLRDLYDELLPNFKSSLFNVGLDETFDLGQGRSAGACEAAGRHRVYLDFVRQVHGLVQERGRRMQFWGDIVLESPELIAELPRDLVALEWGYEADHPFAENSRSFAASGLDFYVCPGTSSWNSLAGRAENALLNLSRAAVQGLEAGASGYLITDWGDNGHLQPLPVSYLGLLAGAGFAWNVSSAPACLDWPWVSLLNRHAFAQREVGQAAWQLGQAYATTGARLKNSSPLFLLLLFPDQSLLDRRLRGLTEEGLKNTLEAIEQAASSLRSAPKEAPETALICRELGWVAHLLSFACRLTLERLQLGGPGRLDGLGGAVRGRLARELEELVHVQEEIWLARNRSGGLADSRARLERVVHLLGQGEV